MLKSKTPNRYIADDYSNFKKGIDLQRERFKMGKCGDGANNYDLMCDAIENIKSEIQGRMIKAGYKEKLVLIEKIIRWYRAKEIIYAKNTEDGVQTVYPAQINLMINFRLTKAYELLIEALDNLNLL